MRAVVVGIPAVIDPGTGLATAGPNVHWQGFDLMGILAAEVAEPFEVDNDVNLGALGQAWRGAGRGVHSFVTISLGTGIGGGIVIDGHLIRGRHNAAGEVGYLPVGGGGTRRRAAAASVRRGRLRGRRVRSGAARPAERLIADGRLTSLTADFAVADVFAAAAPATRSASRWC